MKRFLLTVAVLGLSACVGSAEEPRPAAPTPTAQPVIMGTPSTTYMMTTTEQPARRGLLARLRSRRAVTYYSAPVMTTPLTPSTTTPMPMPMPGSSTGLQTVSPNPMPVVVAGGMLPPGVYTATDGTVIRVSGTGTGSPVTTAMYEQPARRGLFGRLRNR